MPKKYESPYAKPATKEVKPVRAPLPPSVLGTGMAAQAGKTLKNRGRQLDDAIKKAGG